MKKVYDNILSDEGGRFYHSQIRYMACELEKKKDTTSQELIFKTQKLILFAKLKIGGGQSINGYFFLP